MRKPNNYWKDIENVLKEIKIIENEIGYFPTSSDLKRVKQTSLDISISKYHGGMNNIRNILNKPIIRVENGYWENRENIKKEIMLFVDRYGVEKLKYKHLKTQGYNDLTNGMKRKKISLSEICDELGLDKNFTPKGYLKNKDNIILEAKLLLDKYGCFPPREVLIKEGKSSLEVMMQRHHGGLSELYNILGIEKSNLSNIEIFTKNVLDKYIKDDPYIDNAFSKLKEYNVELINPNSGRWLQLDRFYYKKRIAIEIQGKQHYTPTKHKFFNEERTKNIKIKDQIKKELLDAQKIPLILIPYHCCSETYIKQQISKYWEI